MIKPIQMSVVGHTWACQKKFSIFNLQYVKTELSYDRNFFCICIGIHRNGKLIQLFQAFKRNSVCQSDCLILLHIVSLEGQQFSTMGSLRVSLEVNLV